MSFQLASLSATEAVAHFETGTLSPVALVRCVVERAEQVEPAPLDPVPFDPVPFDPVPLY